MLIEQGGDQVLLDLILHQDTNSCVVNLCRMVICTLVHKKFLSNATVERLRSAGICIDV